MTENKLQQHTSNY